MTLITKKERMASGANLRPCLECMRTKNLFILTEQCCENKRVRMIPGINVKQLQRCRKGVCKEHVSSLTIGKLHIDVCCPDCFKEEWQRAMGAS